MLSVFPELYKILAFCWQQTREGRQDATSFATAEIERRVREPRRRGGSGARRSARKRVRHHISLDAPPFAIATGRAAGIVG